MWKLCTGKNILWTGMCTFLLTRMWKLCTECRHTVREVYEGCVQAVDMQTCNVHMLMTEYVWSYTECRLICGHPVHECGLHECGLCLLLPVLSLVGFVHFLHGANAGDHVLMPDDKAILELTQLLHRAFRLVQDLARWPEHGVRLQLNRAPASACTVRQEWSIMTTRIIKKVGLLEDVSHVDVFEGPDFWVSCSTYTQCQHFVTPTSTNKQNKQTMDT